MPEGEVGPTGHKSIQFSTASATHHHHTREPYPAHLSGGPHLGAQQRVRTRKLVKGKHSLLDSHVLQLGLLQVIQHAQQQQNTWAGGAAPAKMFLQLKAVDTIPRVTKLPAPSTHLREANVGQLLARHEQRGVGG